MNTNPITLLLSTLAVLFLTTSTLWAQAATPTFTAAEQTQIDEFVNVFGKNVQWKNAAGLTLLHLAAGEGNTAVVRYLVSQGADMNVKNNRDLTPLDFARTGNHTAVVRYLESVGAQGAAVATPPVAPPTPTPAARPVAPATPPRPSAPDPFIFTAAEQVQIDGFVAQHGRDVRAPGRDGWSLLHQAVRWSDVAVVRYLVSLGADVNARRSCGGTPLSLTGLGNKAAIVEFLVSQGANVDAKNNDGETPLHSAAFFGNIEVIKSLLSHGAELNARDNRGRTPLDRARSQSVRPAIQYLESIGATSGITQTATPASRPATPAPAASAATPRPPTPTPAAPAAAPRFTAAEQAEIDRFLAHHRAVFRDNVRGVDEHGLTLLHWAARQQPRSSALWNVAVARYLVSQGANVHARANLGSTPFHTAVFMDNLEVARFLVSQGADVNARCNLGSTALDTAMSLNLSAMIRYLESIGARTGQTQAASRPASPAPATRPATTPAPAAVPQRSPHQQAVSAVIDRDRSRWQALRNQHRFSSNFVNAGERYINTGSLADLRRFAQIQQRYTGDVIDL